MCFTFHCAEECPAWFDFTKYKSGLKPTVPFLRGSIHLVLKLEYTRTSSMPWPLMPWLLVVPGHQQPWYWLCKISSSLSSIRKDFNNLCHLNVEKTIVNADIYLCSWNEFSTRFNSLWPSDARWQHGSGSTLAQAMAWCSQAASHHLSQSQPMLTNQQWGCRLMAFT